MSSSLNWFREWLETHSTRTAAIWSETALTYAALLDRVAVWQQRLTRSNLSNGDVCAIIGDETCDTCAALLAALFEGLIVVPLCSMPADRLGQCLETAHAQAVVGFDTSSGEFRIERIAQRGSHPLMERLRAQGRAGIVLFSSGSTGAPKAVLWDAEPLIARHRQVRRTYRTLVFLRLDHIGGLNTLFHVLCGGETLVAINQRDVPNVCNAIARHHIELLPTTPTFLTMLLVSGAVERFDLSSLRRITYGTEPMHQGVLQSLAAALPGVDFKQTYGLSEVGILPTRSANRDSLWVKLDGNGVSTRVVDGELWVRGSSAMLGYLNYATPFDSDGWFNTHDAVEVQGDYVRILGRTSEIINVGGEKVYPAEVEDVLLKAENVRAAAVRGRRNAITGQVVTARVALAEAEPPREAERRLLAFCRRRLAPFQVPALIEFALDPLHNERGKTVRIATGA
jgi:acyl-CoA synthetase (AMP-forming)/AMP-acid ligase II